MNNTKAVQIARLKVERDAAQAETKRTLEVFGVINDGLIAEAKRLKAENTRLRELLDEASSVIGQSCLSGRGENLTNRIRAVLTPEPGRT